MKRLIAIAIHFYTSLVIKHEKGVNYDELTLLPTEMFMLIENNDLPMQHH